MKSIETRFANVKKSKTLKNLIQLYDLDKKAVLDIGCLYGEFLKNFGAGSKGVTLSESEAEWGRSAGLDIVCGNIESENFDLKDKFDYIFANNIIEHLNSPHLFLIKIKKYLKDEGRLILGVPILPKLSFLIKFKKFRGAFASCHINFFTKCTLRQTLIMAGWDIDVGRSFHFGNPFFDRLLHPITPHLYYISKINPNFSYSKKREKELESR